MARIPASERDAFYEARRQELADVALKLWAERGFDKTSVAAITREAGVAKGTFYLYFESKQALLLEVMRRNSLIPNVMTLIDDLQSASLEDAVEGFVRGAWRHLSENRELVLLAMGELSAHLDEARDIIERVVAPSNEAVARYLASHISAERAEVLSTVIGVRALIGMVLVVFVSQEMLGAGRVLPVAEDDIIRTISELFLRGVAPETAATGRGVDASSAAPVTASVTAPATAPAHPERARGDDP